MSTSPNARPAPPAVRPGPPPQQRPALQPESIQASQSQQFNPAAPDSPTTGLAVPVSRVPANGGGAPYQQYQQPQPQQQSQPPPVPSFEASNAAANSSGTNGYGSMRIAPPERIPSRKLMTGAGGVAPAVPSSRPNTPRDYDGGSGGYTGNPALSAAYSASYGPVVTETDSGAQPPASPAGPTPVVTRGPPAVITRPPPQSTSTSAAPSAVVSPNLTGAAGPPSRPPPKVNPAPPTTSVAPQQPAVYPTPSASVAPLPSSSEPPAASVYYGNNANNNGNNGYSAAPNNNTAYNSAGYNAAPAGYNPSSPSNNASFAGAAPSAAHPAGSASPPQQRPAPASPYNNASAPPAGVVASPPNNSNNGYNAANYSNAPAAQPLPPQPAAVVVVNNTATNNTMTNYNNNGAEADDDDRYKPSATAASARRPGYAEALAAASIRSYSEDRKEAANGGGAAAGKKMISPSRDQFGKLNPIDRSKLHAVPKCERLFAYEQPKVVGKANREALVWDPSALHDTKPRFDASMPAPVGTTLYEVRSRRDEEEEMARMNGGGGYGNNNNALEEPYEGRNDLVRQLREFELRQAHQEDLRAFSKGRGASTANFNAVDSFYAQNGRNASAGAFSPMRRNDDDMMMGDGADDNKMGGNYYDLMYGAPQGFDAGANESNVSRGVGGGGVNVSRGSHNYHRAQRQQQHIPSYGSTYADFAQNGEKIIRSFPSEWRVGSGQMSLNPNNNSNSGGGRSVDRYGYRENSRRSSVSGGVIPSRTPF